MKIIIESPVSAYLEDYTQEDIRVLREQLAYKNGKIEQLLKRHMNNGWWRQKNALTWEERKVELMSQLNNNLLEKDAKGYNIKPGFIPYIDNLSFTIKNKVKQPSIKPLPWIREPEFTPYPYQSQSVKKLLDIGHGNVSLPTGCHSAGTKIMMTDGRLKKVENVEIGDELMGPDGKSRKVLRLVSGEEEMFKITPNFGDPFVVNKNHILSLKCTNLRKDLKFKSQDKENEVVNISVKDYLEKSNYFKHIHKLYRVKINKFNRVEQKLPINPYIFGLWLGDGNSHDFSITNIDSEVIGKIEDFSNKESLFLRKNGDMYTLSNFDLHKSKGTKGNRLNLLLKEMEVYKNKHIPDIYKYSSVNERRALLAGLLDSDGYNHKGCFEISQKNKRLFDDIVFLSRSLGFGVSQKEEKKYASNTLSKNKNIYYRANIRGDFTKIPIQIERKKINEYSLNRDPLKTGFKIESVGTGKYYGFTVDKDHLYVMGDFTVTHNCGKSFILLMLAQQIGKDVVIVTPSKSIFMELMEEFQTRLGKTKVGGYGNGKKDIKKPITIAIGKSISMLKEGTKEYEFFAKKKALLVDESHTWAADKLEEVCHGVLANASRRFFVSATQTRGDGTVKLLHSIIGETVLEMSIEEAIAKKYLCPLKFNVLSTYSPSTKYTKEALENKREHFLYNDNIAKYASKIANAKWRVNQESTLILVEELVQINKLTKLLEIPFTYIHSASKKEAAKNGLEKVDLKTELERFNNGDVKVLIGTKSIATGTNIYPTHNVINWVGGSSEIVTKQGTMGRSTRWMKKKYQKKHKEKTHSEIWDFDVEGQPILQRMLKTRIKYYEETGQKVKVIK